MGCAPANSRYFFNVDLHAAVLKRRQRREALFPIEEGGCICCVLAAKAQRGLSWQLLDTMTRDQQNAYYDAAKRWRLKLPVQKKPAVVLTMGILSCCLSPAF
jgi:hypothetical protein